MSKRKSKPVPTPDDGMSEWREARRREQPDNMIVVRLDGPPDRPIVVQHKAPEQTDPTTLAAAIEVSRRLVAMMKRNATVNLLRIDYTRDGRRCIAWAGTKREADERKRALKLNARDKASGIDPKSVTVEAVDVPTDRPHLLMWLSGLTAEMGSAAKLDIQEHVRDAELRFGAAGHQMVPEFTVPSAIEAGKVLVHNHIRHTARTPSATRGFRGWFQAKASNLKPCSCGWSGLPHYIVDRPGIDPR